jgi:hypothetical protein
MASGEANTHLKIRSPISGHVITKYVREGQYVEEGTPLYDVADLSTVWIEAQVYEDDLAFLPAGYEQGSRRAESDRLDVIATTRAFPNERFHGKLAFIYPHVDQDTRTVTVRFELDNPDHKLRPGSTATVTLKVEPKELRMLTTLGRDPEQGAMLEQGRVLAVPESSVIDTGSQQIVYRESSPGVYEGVDVSVGPRMTGPEGVILYPVLRGLKPGELVVTSGSFLVDAETRLNPAAGSIYFGGSGGSQTKQSHVTTVRPSTPEDPDAKIRAALASLSDNDRKLAEEQQFCPVFTSNRLGVMGTPVKVMVDGQPVFLCCSGCNEKALTNPKATLATVERIKARSAATVGVSDSDNSRIEDDREAEIEAALAKLSLGDRQAAEAQRFCPVIEDSRLGSMGPPVKVIVEGQPVFLCCAGCKAKALADPKATLTRVARLKRTSANESNQ